MLTKKRLRLLRLYQPRYKVHTMRAPVSMETCCDPQHPLYKQKFLFSLTLSLKTYFDGGRKQREKRCEEGRGQRWSPPRREHRARPKQRCSCPLAAFACANCAAARPCNKESMESAAKFRRRVPGVTHMAYLPSSFCWVLIQRRRTWVGLWRRTHMRHNRV